MPESPDQAPPKRRTRAAPATSSSGFRDVENPAGMASLFIRTDTQSPPLFLLARLGCSIGPIAPAAQECRRPADLCPNPCDERGAGNTRAGESRSEEHTSELQSLMRISYAVFCLKKKKNNYHTY